MGTLESKGFIKPIYFLKLLKISSNFCWPWSCNQEFILYKMGQTNFSLRLCFEKWASGQSWAGQKQIGTGHRLFSAQTTHNINAQKYSNLKMTKDYEHLFK